MTEAIGPLLYLRNASEGRINLAALLVLPDGQETIAIRPILRLALTFDHRAVDGADATRCLVDICRRLEAWDADDYR